MSIVAVSAGRVLALDPGAKRIGVSVSDSGRTMAFPRPALKASDQSGKEIAAMVDEEAITHVVVGLPRLLSGKEGPSASMARELAATIAEALGASEVCVELHDERLTTVSAAQSLSGAGKSAREQRSVIDSAAATVLLESWLAGR